MKIITINQLLSLTLREILDIRRELERQLVFLRAGSVEHREAIETLANIEIVLALPQFRLAITGLGSPSP